jgi:hypothetical protein
VLRLCTEPHDLCGYYYNPEHVEKDCPYFLKKQEKKNTHCNMVTAKLFGKNKKDDEVGLCVVTWEGVKI